MHLVNRKTCLQNPLSSKTQKARVWCHQIKLCFVHIFLTTGMLYNCYHEVFQNKRHHTSEVVCWPVIKNLVAATFWLSLSRLRMGSARSGRKAFFFRQTTPNLLLSVSNGLGTEKCYPVYDASFSHYRRFMD